jgi:hypothetical protein
MKIADCGVKNRPEVSPETRTIHSRITTALVTGGGFDRNDRDIDKFIDGGLTTKYH